MATAAARARTKPKRRLPPEILTDPEVLAVMRACGESDTGVRNQALIAILYRLPWLAAVAEALALYPKGVDAAAGMVRVRCGKGGRSRTVGIDAGGAAVLARWLTVRRRWGSPTVAASQVPMAVAQRIMRHRDIRLTAEV